MIQLNPDQIRAAKRGELTREEAKSIRGTINAGLRETRGGGRPQSCFCGVCASCKRRVKRQTAQSRA
jgi:hypothetical protein